MFSVSRETTYMSTDKVSCCSCDRKVKKVVTLYDPYRRDMGSSFHDSPRAFCKDCLMDGLKALGEVINE